MERAPGAAGIPDIELALRAGNFQPFAHSRNSRENISSLTPMSIAP
jgi:hypothetical protein